MANEKACRQAPWEHFCLQSTKDSRSVIFKAAKTIKSSLGKGPQAASEVIAIREGDGGEKRGVGEAGREGTREEIAGGDVEDVGV